MKTFSQFLLEATDPKGPIKKYMSPKEIAKKHKLSLDVINSQLEMGIKVESEHTGSKQMARMIALQHLEELPDYYTRLKKAEKIKEEIKSNVAKPTNVATEETIIEKKDACYNKVKSRYSVWPSAYASGALVKCRKVGAKNWGTKSEDTNALGYEWDTPIRERPDRYCPKCQKLELRSECKYGTKYWDMFSLPAELITSKKDYNITMPYPGNIKEKYGFSNWRDDFSPIEYEFTDLISADPIKTLKNPLIQEDITTLNSRGASYLIFLLWRGQNISVQMFFPQLKRPSKNEVEYEVKKLYPLAKVLKFEPIKIDPLKALIFAGKQK